MFAMSNQEFGICSKSALETLIRYCRIIFLYVLDSFLVRLKKCKALNQRTSTIFNAELFSKAKVCYFFKRNINSHYSDILAAYIMLLIDLLSAASTLKVYMAIR